LTQFGHDLADVSSLTDGIWEYWCSPSVLGLGDPGARLGLLRDDMSAAKGKAMNSTQFTVRWACIAFSGVSIIISVVVAGVAVSRYHTLRDGMEIPEWYDSSKEGAWTLSQLLVILLVGSESITVLEALTGKESARPY
jgi:hypothetical protein